MGRTRATERGVTSRCGVATYRPSLRPPFPVPFPCMLPLLPPGAEPGCVRAPPTPRSAPFRPHHKPHHWGSFQSAQEHIVATRIGRRCATTHHVTLCSVSGSVRGGAIPGLLMFDPRPLGTLLVCDHQDVTLHVATLRGPLPPPRCCAPVHRGACPHHTTAVQRHAARHRPPGWRQHPQPILVL